MVKAPGSMIATMAVAASLFFAAPASAQPTGGQVVAELWGCFPGESITAVVDGETAASSPTTAVFGPETLTIDIPDGVPGNVLAVVCSGALPFDRVEAVNIVPGAGSCSKHEARGNGLDGQSTSGTYSNKHNFLCLEIISTPQPTQDLAPVIFSWSAAGPSAADGQVFEPASTSAVAAPASAEASAAAPLGADTDLTASIEDRSTPWWALQLGAAAMVLAALGFFTTRRRQLAV